MMSDGKDYYHEQKELDYEDDNNIITQELHVNGFSDEKLTHQMECAFSYHH